MGHVYGLYANGEGVATSLRDAGQRPPAAPPRAGAGTPESAPDGTRVRTLCKWRGGGNEPEGRRTAPPRRPAPSGGRDPGIRSGWDTCTDFMQMARGWQRA